VSIRDEVRASAAAHHDLGPGYDTAVAEGLVERIGDEIDRRVDARMFAHLQGPAPAPPRPKRAREPGRVGAGTVLLALFSLGAAVGGTVAVLHPSSYTGQNINFGQVFLVMMIWVVIGAINISYARRH
jgi:hypothetical protein